VLVAKSAEMEEPHKVHLKVVMEGGLGQYRPQTVGMSSSLLAGLSDGSRSAKMLKAVHRSVSSQYEAH
jgi:hypothetical protein